MVTPAFLSTFKTLGVVYQPGTPAFEQFGPTPLVAAESLEGALDFVVFLILITLGNKRPFKGFVFLLYAFLYSLCRFGLEYLRADSLRTVLNLKTAQLSSVIIAILCVLIAIYRYKKNRSAQVRT